MWLQAISFHDEIRIFLQKYHKQNKIKYKPYTSLKKTFLDDLAS